MPPIVQGWGNAQTLPLFTEGQQFQPASIDLREARHIGLFFLLWFGFCFLCAPNPTCLGLSSPMGIPGRAQ